jgi:hypothetical protein
MFLQTERQWLHVSGNRSENLGSTEGKKSESLPATLKMAFQSRVRYSHCFALTDLFLLYTVFCYKSIHQQCSSLATSSLSWRPPPQSSYTLPVPGRYLIQLKPGMNSTMISLYHDQVCTIHARNHAHTHPRENSRGSGGVEHNWEIGSFQAHGGAFGGATVEEFKVLPEVSDDSHEAWS